MPAFGILRTRVCELAGLPEGGEFLSLVNLSMNSVYRRLLGLVPGEQEIREFTLATRVDVSKYGMPLYVDKVVTIEDTANSKNIYTLTNKRFDETYPGTTETGTPDRARMYGVYGVQRQPAATGAIGIRSSAAGDSGSGYVVTVVGLNGSTVLVRDEVTLTGTTEVATTNSYASVERVVKTPASGTSFAGNITVEDSSDNEISVIPIWW